MYATRVQMETLFGEGALAHLTGGADVIVADVLDGAMAAAQAEVDGYLSSVATLPLARVPDVIRVHACGIAYWYLDVDNPTEGAKERYRAAIRFLERVQDGKAGLGLADDGAPVEAAGGVAIDAHQPVFTRARLRGFTG